MYKIEYCDRISSCGIEIEGIGRIHSPFLKDVFEYGVRQYHEILGLMILSPKDYFSSISEKTKKENIWDSLTNEQKNDLSMFDVMISNDYMLNKMIGIFSLFIFGDLSWDKRSKSILVNKKIEKSKTYVDGTINKTNYTNVLSLCLQFADIDNSDIESGPVKFRTEKDREFYESFMEKKKKNSKNKKSDKNLELDNIISVVCVYHNSLNYTNIFNITICQLHDVFSRMNIERQITIQQNNYSVWGGKFDYNKWYEHL